jgi:hypothetical protein
MGDNDGGFSGGGLSLGGGFSTGGLGNTGLGSGNTGNGGLGLGPPSGGFFGGGGGFSGGGGQGLQGTTDNLFSYNPSFTGGYSPAPSYSLGDLYSQDTGTGFSVDGSYGLQAPSGGFGGAETGLGLGGEQEQDKDFWSTGWGRFVKGLGQFALSTNPVGRAALTGYGLYNAAQNKNYGALAQGLVGAATGNGLAGAVAGIGTNAAMGRNVRGPVGSTLGGMIGGGIAGPLGGMIGSQVGRSVATSDRAPVGGTSYGDRTLGGGRSGIDAGQLAAGLGSLYLNNRAARTAESNVQDLSSMFGPNSAYAQQLKQQLERRDAAAGRRSQYGPREVELQAKLAQMAAQYGPNISQSNMQAQQVSNQRRQQNLSALYAMARESGLMDQISSGLGNLFSSTPSNALYMDDMGSGTSYSV